jgi:DNA-binding transcriptional regulator YiaG/ribosome-binding protein aMBF1 (putative translation factor)
MCYFLVGLRRAPARGGQLTTQQFGSGTSPAERDRRTGVTVRIGNRTYVFDDTQAPVVVGRDASAQVLLVDEHVSGQHLRLEHTAEGWVIRDSSLNGTFINGSRQAFIPIRGATTVHLGHARGVALTITEDTPAPHLPPSPPVAESDEPDDDDDEITTLTEITDPGVARAGAAVAARRKELDLAQRYLASSGIISAGSLIDFEKGRRWPRTSTRAKLEEALGWPQGRIVSIRNQDIEADDEQTVTLTGVERSPLMAEVMEVALSNIAMTIDSLPAPTDSDFTARSGRALADLRTLEASAAAAARTATGSSSMAKILGAIRKTYRELMLQAARAPGATLGQQLFAARHRSELTVDEFANAAGVPADAVRSAESEAALPPGTVAALTAALASL